MSNNPITALSMTALDDAAWDDLLNFIEERRVIPIVGAELLMVSTEQGPRLLQDWVAERLAVRLNVNTAQLPKPYTLNDIVCWFSIRNLHDVRQWSERIQRTEPTGHVQAASAALERSAG